MRETGSHNSRAHLAGLLAQMSASPGDETALAERIDADFGEHAAVLVLDMSGFSRTVQQRGIAAFLLMIHRMAELARGTIEAEGGLVVKVEADNLYCLLDDANAAIAAARAIIDALDAANLGLAEDRKLYASIGIGYGRILNIAHEDLFGDEVNLASKLGEDIAERGEILLTPEARANAAPGLVTRENMVSVSGLTLVYHGIV